VITDNSNKIICMERREEGRGLLQIETTYKAEIINNAEY
jgi:hypothetical protein